MVLFSTAGGGAMLLLRRVGRRTGAVATSRGALSSSSNAIPIPSSNVGSKGCGVPRSSWSRAGVLVREAGSWSPAALAMTSRNGIGRLLITLMRSSSSVAATAVAAEAAGGGGGVCGRRGGRMSQGLILLGRRVGATTARVGAMGSGNAVYHGAAANSIGVIGESLSVSSTTATATATSAWGNMKMVEFCRYWGRCYFELSKARLSFLVVTTAGAGYVMASGEVVDWTGFMWTSIGTMMAASSANAFNQVMEVVNDAAMKRTMKRPLPSGRIRMPHAIAFASLMGLGGVTLLFCKENALTAALGAGNIALYTLVYTPLKQLHVANTWVGAVVGGIPPLMGWAAVRGELDWSSGVLAAALYLWQIPHFMALAWLCRADYAKGGYKMMSLIDSSGRRTASAALRNAIYLLPLGYVALELGLTSEFFVYENVLLAGWLIASAVAFYKTPSQANAGGLFRASLLYLPLLMTAMLIHRNPQKLEMVNTERQRQWAHEEAAMKMVPLVGETKEMAVASRMGEGERRGLGRRHDSAFLSSRNEDVAADGQHDAMRFPPHKEPLPPIAHMLVAPFPFLPAPHFGV